MELPVILIPITLEISKIMTTYADLVNVNGTIYNKITGKGYSSPDELAKERRRILKPKNLARNWNLQKNCIAIIRSL